MEQHPLMASFRNESNGDSDYTRTIVMSHNDVSSFVSCRRNDDRMDGGWWDENPLFRSVGFLEQKP
jgi:hypothetical protein